MIYALFNIKDDYFTLYTCLIALFNTKPTTEDFRNVAEPTWTDEDTKNIYLCGTAKEYYLKQIESGKRIKNSGNLDNIIYNP